MFGERRSGRWCHRAGRGNERQREQNGSHAAVITQRPRAPTSGSLALRCRRRPNARRRWCVPPSWALAFSPLALSALAFSPPRPCVHLLGHLQVMRSVGSVLLAKALISASSRSWKRPQIPSRSSLVLHHRSASFELRAADFDKLLLLLVGGLGAASLDLVRSTPLAVAIVSSSCLALL